MFHSSVSSIHRFSFSAASPTFVTVVFFVSHPSGCAVVAHCGFDTYFPNGLVFFPSVLFGHFMSSLEKYLLKFLTHINFFYKVEGRQVTQLLLTHV